MPEFTSIEDENQEILETDEEYASKVESKLSLQQKIILLVSGFLLYFVFLIISFPYSQFFRYFLNKGGAEIKIDYTDFHIGIFSPSIIKDLMVSSSQINFKGEEMILKFNMWSFINQKFSGNILLDNGYFKVSSIGGNLNTMNFIININQPITSPPNTWSGNINLSVKSFKLESTFGPLQSIITDSAQLEAKNLRANIVLDNGNYKINRFDFDSVLFKISIIANGSLKKDLETSTMQGEVCLIPAPNLEEINPTIYNMYIMAGGSIGGKLCLKIEGSFNQPKFEPKS